LLHLVGLISLLQRNLFSVSVGRDSNHSPSHYITESDSKL